jgi:hypothetical protein
VSLYESTVVALVHTLAARPYIVNEHRFVLRQCLAMPDFLSLAMRMLTISFAVYIIITHLMPFHRLSLKERIRVLARLQNSRITVCRDFVRFYQTLTLFSIASEKDWMQ